MRLVSFDTPEKAAYAGNSSRIQPKLNACRDRLANGFYDALPRELRDYFLDKLAVADAARRHIEAGDQASAEFDRMLAARLTLPSGELRKVAVIPTGEVVDAFGRLLAYVAPWFAGPPHDPLPPRDDPRRRTLNLDMIANGWAAFFPVYPSLPRNPDMNLAIAAAEAAGYQQRGAWAANGPRFLLGYEYRACIKLADAPSAADGISEAFRRHCVDLRTLRNVGTHGFWDVPPCYRLWLWEEDLAQATDDLGLLP